MAKYYPAFLNLKGRPCMVVGGGAVAERKVKALLECGAAVSVVSPEITPRLRRRVDMGQIKLVERPYQENDYQGMYLLIAATDDMRLNRSIGREASNDGVLVNVVDDPAYCDFIAPSLVQRGDITFAISTGGGSPALARWLRTQIKTQFPSEYGRLAALLSQVRLQLKREGRRVSPGRWQRSIDKELLSLIKKRKLKEARLRLMASLTNGRAGSG
ncbi:MAG: bifunctional precorrin-2 dehydrogenase/sirohydrochlorin ferrochelatase [Dehalococcoidia bacterium]